MMMRTFALIVMLLLVDFAMSQQNDATRSIGISYPLFAHDNVSIAEQNRDGTAYNGRKVCSFGLSYIYSTCNCSAYEAGIEYSIHDLCISPAPTGQVIKPYDSKVSLFSLPLTLRLHFFKYFFISGGTMLDIDVTSHESISNQSGFGIHCGMGMKYDFKSGIGIYMNPYFKSHSWVSFNSGHDKQRLDESGLRLGIMVKFRLKT
jgi:hypothetical protein